MDLAPQEMLPHAEKWDEEEIFPEDTLRKLAELGFAGTARLLPLLRSWAAHNMNVRRCVQESTSRTTSEVAGSPARTPPSFSRYACSIVCRVSCRVLRVLPSVNRAEHGGTITTHDTP